MTRSTETIRLTLKTYDREHPDRAIFAPTLAPLDEEAKSQIYRRYRMGVSVEVLAAQFGRTRSSIYRLINEVRARRILETKLEFIPHVSFDDPAAAAQIMAPMPQPADGKAPRRPRAPKGLPPYLASLYEVPLLDREQEAHLFRQMNYLKFQPQNSVRTSSLRQSVGSGSDRGAPRTPGRQGPGHPVETSVGRVDCQAARRPVE